MRSKSGSGRTPAARARLAGAILAAGGAAICLAACVGPLGPSGNDRGEDIDAAMLNRINRFDPARYARDEPGAPNADGNGAGAGAPTGEGNAPAEPPAVEDPPPRPPSRFEGLEEYTLTLEEMRAQTLANNLDLRVTLVDPTLAAEALKGERAKFESVFRPTAGYREDDQPTLDITNPNSQDSMFGALGVDIPLRTGGRASVDLSQDYAQTNNPFFTFNDSYSNALRFSLSQPLLRGAGREVNEHSIRLAAISEQQSWARTKLEVIRVLAASDRAYWRLYAARRSLEVTQRQYELAVEQLSKARRRMRAGDVAEIEVVRAEAGLADRLESIILAESDVLTQQREIKRLIHSPGLEMESTTVLLTGTEPSPRRYELPAADLATQAETNRMEMLELELQIAADASTVEFARNQALPAVALDYSYTIQGLGGTMHDSREQLIDHNFESWQVGVSAEIPIGNEQAKSRVQQAILTRLQRLATREARRESIRQEALAATDQVGTGWQRILAARQNVIAAGRALIGEQRQFDAGARTSTDVLDAATRLAEAQLAEIRAITDYEVALVDLSFATGTTLGAADIDWAPIDPR